MKDTLQLKDYAEAVNLYSTYVPTPVGNARKSDLVDYLLTELGEATRANEDYDDKRRFLHGKLNSLHPNVLNNEAIDQLNKLLQLELNEKNITSVDNLSAQSEKEIEQTKVTIWQGDITTINADVIVNAANSQMLGCFQPLHACIDNAIHSAAGVQLRDDCDLIMEMQGFNEPTSAAKITRAYNLPAKYVLHTVGPIAQGVVNDANKRALAQAYVSCLDVCKQLTDIRSIAFCGISTGVFGFPAGEAAKVAIAAVSNWLQQNPNALDLVVFNVFSDGDKNLYQPLIAQL